MAAAKKIADQSKHKVPPSLSAFPPGKAASTSALDAMTDMDNGVDLMGAMDDMTPEQIEQYLNRL